MTACEFFSDQLERNPEYGCTVLPRLRGTVVNTVLAAAKERAMNLQPTDLILSGKRVHAWTGGSGPALLLLHSAWGDAEMSWAQVWNELSRSFTVIAPDMPGFGVSDPLDDPTLANYARLFKDLLDRLKIDNAIVVGNSFGVAVAIEFASTFPERARHLVAINGGYLPLIPVFLKKLIGLSAVEKRFRKFIRNMTYSDKAFSKAFPNPDKLPAGFFDRIRQHEEQQARIVFDTVMRQSLPQKRPRVPATIIWGTGDRLTSMKQAESLRKWLGKPDRVPINNAGHMPQVERPSEFVAAMKALVV
jgi:2-hydroxymuconate-semialdehyde hydrolase